VGQPAKIRDFVAPPADAAIVVAYGKILPAALLATMPFYNVHASLLPKYRGAAPIQRAIEDGERETGVTIMRVDEVLDHGPKLAMVKTEIGPDEHAPSLAARLSTLGAAALVDALAANPPDVPQDHTQATLAPKIQKSEGAVDWSQPAQAIYDKFRAFDPWPGLFTPELKLIDIRPIGVRPSRPHPPGVSPGGEWSGGTPNQSGRDARTPGTILAIDDAGVTVAAGESAIRLITVQRPGKTRVA